MLAAIWNLYLGLFSLLGHTILILIGIGLCGYATAQQLEPLHDPYRDVAIFAVGLVLVSFKMVRRIVWAFAGLALVWSGLVWVGAHALAEHDQSFRLSTELIALAVVPPLLMTFFLEITRTKAVDATELEITLSAPTDKDS